MNVESENDEFNICHSGYHGTSGPMKIADLQLTPLVEAFLDAGRELHYDVLDVNGPRQLGKSINQSINRILLTWLK